MILKAISVAYGTRTLFGLSALVSAFPPALGSCLGLDKNPAERSDPPFSICGASETDRRSLWTQHACNELSGSGAADANRIL